jgi:hypothetical protein
MLDHLSLMARCQRALTATGADEYLVHLERLRRPITFVSGVENLVWLPESTRQTFELLRDEFGEADYRRVEFADYGHQDVFNGALSARDTFPAVLEHLRRVNA